MKVTVNVSLFAASVLAGCVAPSDYTGSVVSFNGNMVEIEGAMNQADGMAVKPTDGMSSLAQSTCKGPAKFAGWSDSRKDQSIVANSFITYRFLCE